MTTNTIHHCYVKEKLEDAGHEVGMVTEESHHMGGIKVFFTFVRKFIDNPSLTFFFRYFPFVRISLFDHLKRRAEKNLLRLNRVHFAQLHLANINELEGHAFAEDHWDIVLVFGTRKISQGLIAHFNDRNIRMINIHCAMLPYIRGLDSDIWSLARRQWHEIGVSIHFVEEGLDTGSIIIQSPTQIENVATPWSIRATLTMRVPQLILDQLSNIKTQAPDTFHRNLWEEHGVYFSHPGVFVQLAALFNFYLNKMAGI